MADSTVRIQNMPDSGSAARVAYDLTKYLINHLPKAESKEDGLNQILDLYADCYAAAQGQRASKRNT